VVRQAWFDRLTNRGSTGSPTGGSDALGSATLTSRGWF